MGWRSKTKKEKEAVDPDNCKHKKKIKTMGAGIKWLVCKDCNQVLQVLKRGSYREEEDEE